MSKEKKAKTLDPREEMFCSNYCALGSDTFHVKGKSALAAGYSESSAGNIATKLLKDPAVQARIQELHAENMSRNRITVDKVLRDLENVRLLAITQGQLGTAKDCSIAQGKHLSMFSDNVNVGQNDGNPEHLSPEVMEAARERAQLRLLGKTG